MTIEEYIGELEDKIAALTAERDKLNTALVRQTLKWSQLVDQATTAARDATDLAERAFAERDEALDRAERLIGAAKVVLDEFGPIEEKKYDGVRFLAPSAVMFKSETILKLAEACK